MIVVVSGWRDATNEHRIVVAEEFGKLAMVTGRHLTIAHGAARGIDAIADELAKHYFWDVHPIEANWKKYGKAAGPLRNNQLLDLKPSLVLAFPHRDSIGTRDMITKAMDRQIPLWVRWIS